MTGVQNITIDILMARDASVGADIKAAQVAHACAHTCRVGPVLAGVAPQPRFRRAVAVFTRYAFVRVRVGPEARRRDRLKWRVTNRAVTARLRWRDPQCFSNSSR